jgi:hypothetical protein
MYIGDHYQSEVMFGAETASITDNGNDISSTAGIVSYDSTLESGNAWGLLVPYRDSAVDDAYDSKSKAIAFIPYYKIRTSINDKLRMDYVLNGTMKLIYLKSTLFPDGGGYYELGGGFGAVPSYKVTDNLSLTGSMTYQYSKKSFPESAVPDEVKFVATAINALPAQQVLTGSFALEYSLGSKFSVATEMMQASHLDKDAVPQGRDKATYYALKTNVALGNVLVQLGYKTVEEVKDYEEDAYMANVSLMW